MESIRDLLRAPRSVDLATIDPRGTPGLPTNVRNPKEWSRDQLVDIGADLAEAQEKLYASTCAGDDHRRLLVILQAMDAGGKDGAVRHVGGAFNPSGLQVTNFKAPTEEERSHHFLWRIRRAVPPPGYVGFWNRSHYEDVLVVRVHNLVPETEWQGRYDEINEFEREIVADGVIPVKIMLHISKEEQRQRLLDRLRDPTKYWKYNPRDLDERKLWDEYMKAYEAALSQCQHAAPWYVVPADRKWYRDWAVASLLREIFDDQRLSYPPPAFDVEAERARLAAA
jgi:PPK2 family polyphosphate:nucleotide phosphotransferase